MTHTAGPWINWETLEWLHEPSKLLTNTEDARLIAAAPEMVEALQAAVFAVEELCQDQFEGNECWSVLYKIRDALSKATT